MNTVRNSLNDDNGSGENRNGLCPRRSRFDHFNEFINHGQAKLRKLGCASAAMLWVTLWKSEDAITGVARVSVRTLAERYGTDTRNVHRMLDQLEANGFLEVTEPGRPGRGSCASYRLLVPAEKVSREHVSEAGKGVTETPISGDGKRVAKTPIEAEKVSPERVKGVTTTPVQKKTEEEKNKTPQPPVNGGRVEATTTALLPLAPPKPKAAPAESVSIPDALDTPEFRAAWGEWLAARRSRQKPVTERAAYSQLAELAGIGPGNAVACIRASIRNDWQGLFPERYRSAPAGRPGLFDRGAAQESRMAAQIAEALAGCGP